MQRSLVGGGNRFTPGNKNFHRRGRERKKGEERGEKETEKLSNFPPFTWRGRRVRERGGRAMLATMRGNVLRTSALRRDGG